MFNFKSHSKEDNEVTVTVTNRTVLRILALIMLSVIAWGAFQQAAHALLLIFTSFFLALALNGPVHWLGQRLPGKRRGSRSLATALSFLVIVIALTGFLASIVPPLVKQTATFIEVAPNLIEQTRNQDGTLGNFVRKYNLENQTEKFSQQLSGRLENGAGTALTSITKLGSSIFTVLTILALTFMMLVEGPHWLKMFRDLLPDKKEPHFTQLLEAMYKVVKGYVNGQVLLAALAAILILPAMIALGIPYPIALMVIVFICGLIPMVGHTIGASIVTAVALFNSPLSAVIILAYYILYQQIENYIIQPRIQANSTNMSPLLVFSSVVIGVNFGGLFGGLVAIPVAGCLRILVIDYLERKHLIAAAPSPKVAVRTAFPPKQKKA